MTFECIECGYSSVKWQGKCPSCGEWNTFEEVSKYQVSKAGVEKLLNTETKKLSEIEYSNLKRLKCGISGFDRLLGGGVVEGEVILLGGPPGIGKSTLFLQIADKFASQGLKVLFVSGEETPAQIKIHSDRLKISGKNITVVGSGDITALEGIVAEKCPKIIFVDSIQAVMDPELGGSPGSLRQIKKCGQKLTVLAKNSGAVIFISGQITKQGDIAGPKVLEHIVDVVFYIDLTDGNERIMSAAKNRFGSCGDFMLFEITDTGLVETETSTAIENKIIQGQASCSTRRGARLTVVELQALVTTSYFEYPLRRTSGFSRERLLMLTAITMKYLGLKLSNMDVYLNVSGPNKVSERVCDLGIVAAIYSSCKNIGLSNKIMFLGEVGLSGEVRSVKDIKERVNFAARNNFEIVVLSDYKETIPENITVRKISKLSELRDII